MGLRARISARFRANTFARNVAILAGGTALGQVVAVAATPILTRVYEPADFGVLEFYLGVVALLSVVSNMRFHEAIPLPDTDDEAAPLVTLGIASSFVAAILAAVVVLLFRQRIAELADAPALSTALLVLPLAVLIYGANLTLQGWMVRVGDYTSLAKVNVRQGVVLIISQISFGLSRLASTGLVLGHAAGNSAGLLTFLSRARNSGLRPRSAVQVDAMGPLVRQYRRFPLLRGPTTLLNTAAESGVPIALTLMFGPVTAGFYALVSRLLGLPMLLVGQSTMRVFYGEAARMVRERESKLAPLLDTTAKNVGAVTGAAVLLGAIASTWLLPFFFGSKWEPAVPFLQVMAPMWVIRIARTTVSGVFSVLERQRLELGLELLRLALVGGALGTGYLLALSPVNTIALVSILGVVSHVLTIAVSRRVAAEFDHEVRRENFFGTPASDVRH